MMTVLLLKRNDRLFGFIETQLSERTQHFKIIP